MNNARKLALVLPKRQPITSKTAKTAPSFDLNSDVAGGYSASMLDAVRRALDVSKILSIQDPEYNTLTFEEVFRLATLGGSQGWKTI